MLIEVDHFARRNHGFVGQRIPKHNQQSITFIFERVNLNIDG